MYSAGRGIVPLVRANPVPDDSRADHVADKIVVVSVPHKQGRTRTSAPVSSDKAARDWQPLRLVCNTTGRPQASAPRRPAFACPRRRRCRSNSAQISGRAIDLKLLPVRSREDFHLGAMAGLVSFNPFKLSRSQCSCSHPRCAATLLARDSG